MDFVNAIRCSPLTRSALMPLTTALKPLGILDHLLGIHRLDLAGYAEFHIDIAHRATTEYITRVKGRAALLRVINLPKPDEYT